ncbi:uncharacterized protein [Drosophila bipectinata]|uniref:uncharacterized protein n=1 Tax=Drosophila bipectinata TaxID=42026 RepID=UPI0038B38B8E
MQVIQLNLNHCRAAQDLLRHTVGEVNADIAILKEPYSVGPGEEWATNNQGKAAIWICNSSTEGPSQEWGSTTTNARGRALLEILAPLDLALLNEGNQKPYNRAAAGFIIDLTFVSSSLARTSKWRIADNYTASDHEATLCSLGTSQAISSIPPCGKAFRQDTLDVHQLETHVRTAELDLHATANESAEALFTVLDVACKASMKARTTFARYHKPAPWWISSLRKECLRSRRSLQRARGTDTAPSTRCKGTLSSKQLGKH